MSNSRSPSWRSTDAMRPQLRQTMWECGGSPSRIGTAGGGGGTENVASAADRAGRRRGAVVRRDRRRAIEAVDRTRLFRSP
jgi:hypothetical protein